jgi:long-chain fatty acid transport protein
MRRFLTLLSVTFITGSLFAGGVVTNTNQSASWVRLPSRNASTSIDAVYFNPAGLMRLENGFHFSISNQTILQNKEVENFYTGPGGAFGLNQSLYKGKVTAPVFPSVYAAYKMDRLAFSLGFNPVGGGGGATFEKGLPSFELDASDLVPSLASSMGATGYSLDAYFEGTSVFFGFQGGVSYKINDFISIAAGVRYVMAKNTYLGHLRDITVILPTGGVRADAIMSGIAGQANQAAAGTGQLVAGGAGAYTLAQAEAATIITTQTRMQLEGALEAFGYPASVTIATADAIFNGASDKYTGMATLLGDQEADVEQTGSGYTPFVSVNISPVENLNIGVKYEMATKLELENKTTKDFITGFTAEGAPVTMFPNGEKIRNDMPAMLTVGVDYGVTDKLNLTASGNYYFDKASDYGHKIGGVYVTNDEIFDNNYLELAGGLQYRINDMFLVSGGYLYSKTGVNEKYQSDLTYSLPSSTIGAGGAISPFEKLQINFGVGYTMYQTGERTFNHVLPDESVIPVKETYYKDNIFFAVGVDFSF